MVSNAGCNISDGVSERRYVNDSHISYPEQCLCRKYMSCSEQKYNQLVVCTRR